MKSLNSIFKTFRKTLRDLDKYVEESDKAIDYNNEKIASLESDNIGARWDRERASSARSKIAELIGDE